MLDGGADLGPSGMGALALIRERLAGRSAEVDLRNEAGTQDGAFVLLAAISRICPDRAAGVGRIDQARPFPAVVAGGIIRMKPWRWSMAICDLYPNMGVAISVMSFPSAPFLRRPRQIAWQHRPASRMNG
ncbi:MAG: hypothetical protein P8Y58_12800 [Novosphingobium sp.]